jgi:hypothetical protein
MKIQLTPDLKLKKPTSVILMGEEVTVFHHERGSSHCVIELPDGTSKVAALCDLELVGKQRTAIASGKKALTPEQATEKQQLNAFFSLMAEIAPFKCMNCGKFMFAVNKAAIRAITCHIVPKSIFPELATDPDNVVFMGVYAFGSECDHHAIWDYSVENRVKMAIYPLVIKRYYEKLRDKLSEAKQQLADEYLGITKKSNNLASDISNGLEGVKA